ncbi:acyl-CoA dehydrogenase family protein [Nocardia brasiliensis]|uniref:acyl-CoA dehydrogenase family protein n=1 Tax=Nocardia brasiliensis TaxID=37326 RepID=UPI0024562588|nr:acyl-CoA dehydrogenase family protein [Nocardia brasiliensis]
MLSSAQIDDLADLLFGRRRAVARRYRELFSSADFNQDWWSATQDPGKRAYRRYLRLLPALTPTQTIPDLVELVTLQEQAVAVDPHLSALLTVQMNLVLGTLLEQPSRADEVEAELQELLQGRAVGAYVLTEVGHGSDLSNLETTASYDPSNGGGFVLHTPTDTAVKFMPTTAPPPVEGVARVGIVFARLILDGRSCGNYPFLVRLIDSNGTVRSGVTIRPLPDKPGLGMDNSLTRFDRVRVPRACLLSATGARIDDSGRLVSPIPDENQAWRAISRVRIGRICMAIGAAAVARAALSIAVAHAEQRDIASLSGGRVQLAQVPAHFGRLLDMVADTYVTCVAAESALNAFTEASERDADEHSAALTDLVSLTKYLTTSTALRVCDQVRDHLGAQGVFAHNKIVELRALRDGAATGEGDSFVIALQAAYRRLAQPDEWMPECWKTDGFCDIDTLDDWLVWMSARERYLHHMARQGYGAAIGDRQARWDSVHDLALAAAEAHITNRALQALASRARQLPAGPREVAENLASLFAICQCLANGAGMLPDGPFPKTFRPLRDMRIQLHRALRPYLTDLVHALDLPTALHGTAFGPDTYAVQYAKALTAMSGSESAVAQEPRTPAPAVSEHCSSV